MCETHVNLDGRYDRNRGQLSNFAITPANFNLINDVYILSPMTSSTIGQSIQTSGTWIIFIILLLGLRLKLLEN